MTEKIIVCKYENGELASSSEVKRTSTAFCNVEAFLREMQNEIMSGPASGAARCTPRTVSSPPHTPRTVCGGCSERR